MSARCFERVRHQARPRPVLRVILLMAALWAGFGAMEGRGAERVVYSVTARLKSMDPIASGDLATVAATGRVFESLYEYAPGGPPYVLRPLIARAMPEWSPDGLTCTIRLRRGVHFQDSACFAATGGRGREVTARDVIYSFLRLADAKNRSPGYWILQHRVEGLDAFREASTTAEPTDYDRAVPGLAAPDDFTVQIRLTRPCPQLVHLLAMHYASIVPREAVVFSGAAFDAHPVGTGPFVLKSWRRNYRMEYERNPSYWVGGRIPLPGDSGEPVSPQVDRLIQYVVADTGTQWQMFLQGRLSYIPVTRDAWDAVFDVSGTLKPELKRRSIRALCKSAMDTAYIGFNMEDPVVGANAKLRRAMAMAFDRESWSRFYQGLAVPARTVMPPGTEGIPAGSFVPAYDVSGARALLAEAGYPGGMDPATGRRLRLTLELGDAENQDLRQSTDLFVQDMARIGIELVPSYNSRPAFFDKLAKKQAQLFRLNWVADYPDAENYLQPFYGPNASPGSNRVNFKNTEYDRLYEEMSSLAPSPQRDRLIRQMCSLLGDALPWIPTHHSLNVLLVSPGLSNYEPTVLPGCAEKQIKF